MTEYLHDRWFGHHFHIVDRMFTCACGKLWGPGWPLTKRDRFAPYRLS